MRHVKYRCCETKPDVTGRTYCLKGTLHAAPRNSRTTAYLSATPLSTRVLALLIALASTLTVPTDQGIISPFRDVVTEHITFQDGIHPNLVRQW